MSVKLKALAADSDDASICVCGPRLTPIVDVNRGSEISVPGWDFS